MGWLELESRRLGIVTQTSRCVAKILALDPNQVSQAQVVYNRNELNKFDDKHQTIIDQMYGCSEMTEDLRKILEEGLFNFQDQHEKAYVFLHKLEEDIAKQQSNYQIEQKQMLSDSSFKSSDSSSYSTVKCPRISLPEFDGQLSNWISCRDVFVSLVHNNNKISKIEKFSHLKSMMKLPITHGNVLDNYSFSADNYEHAWKAICSRYDNKNKIASTHIQNILSCKKMQSMTATELRRIIDVFMANISALNNLDCQLKSEDLLSNSIIVHIATSKLDDETLHDWLKFNNNEKPVWEEMCKWLQSQWTSLDDLPTKKSSPKISEVKFQQKPKSFTSTENKTYSKAAVTCALCKESHYLRMCLKFIAMTIEERRKFVREKGLCYNCLSSAHIKSTCTSKMTCRQCNRNHHTMLHPETPVTLNSNGRSSSQPLASAAQLISPDVEPFKPSQQKQVYNAHVAAESHLSSPNRTLFVSQQKMLSTIKLNVHGRNGHLIPARALLDNGSDGNFISLRLAKRLELQLIPTNRAITGIGDKKTIIKHITTTDVSSRYTDYKRQLHFSVMSEITGDLPGQYIDARKFNIPEGYFLADPTFNQPREIDLLLDVETFYDCLLQEKIRLENGPMMIHTKFGWIIGGICYDHHSYFGSSASLLSYHSFKIVSNDDKDLQELGRKVEKFIASEEVEPLTNSLTSEEKYCENLFISKTTIERDGRFIVRMPYKFSPIPLGTNYKNSLSQFYAQESKRKKDPVYNEMYTAYINELIASGHISEISSDNCSNAHYLPHHGVIKLTSDSTKCRPVFNASRKTETGISLNDILCVGPTVQPESFDIIMRTREHRYVIMSDIIKMYLQVWIHPTQRNHLRILWRPSPNERLKHYTINVNTFGTASAPFLATRCLIEIANMYEKDFPEAARIIRESFYVDDLCFGFDSIEKGRNLVDQIRNMLLKSGMTLTKFASNDQQVLDGLMPKDLAKNKDSTIKALGIVFNTSTDHFCYKIKSLPNVRFTKAEVLSLIAGIYDPIGWIGPVVMTLKLFMQKLWTEKLDWKQELTDELHDEWLEITRNLSKIDDIQIARHCYLNEYTMLELHGFCDASIKAYGAVIYAVTRDDKGSTKTSIICAKSKVAPLKQRTLARLELCAATLLAKLINRIKSILSSNIDLIVLWSDSTIVLSWIVMQSTKLQTYVGNRVSVIQDLTQDYQWRHVRGIDNPADVISRGMAPEKIKNLSLWWNGPSFLLKLQSEWPNSVIIANENDPEIKQEVRKSLVSQSLSYFFVFINDRFSSSWKLFRVMAYVLRFSNNAKKSTVKRFGLLTVEEIDSAEIVTIRIIQKEIFTTEYNNLMNEYKHGTVNRSFHPLDKKLNKQSSIHSLTPFMDSQGLIRVGGRISSNPHLTFDQKHQILLPICNFTTTIIRDIHNKNEHTGITATLALIYQKYWPLKAKSIIRKVIYHCRKCHMKKLKSGQQIMSDLPEERSTMNWPFINTAVDYAGFYMIKTGTTRNAPSTKAYVAVFKCMSTGAIHLELVSDLSTKAFIAALDRFVSRRGHSQQIFSDNGTQFQGTNKEFKKILAEMDPIAHEYCTEKSIKWNFTTPRASHAGGVYESAVKNMKQHLSKVIVESYTFERFITILCKIEAILNSRPITPMSDDPTDLRVLTAGHFLTGRPLVSIPEKKFVEVSTNRLNQWEQLQQVQQKFWKLWYMDYLYTLQKRPINFRDRFEYHIGDMVLVKDSNLPPMKWLLGRIIKLFPSKRDKVVRTVRIHTVHGDKDRDVRYLCFLPIANQTEAGENVSHSETSNQNN